MEICHWDKQIDQRNGKESLGAGEDIRGTLVYDGGSWQTREGGGPCGTGDTCGKEVHSNLCLTVDSRISSRDFPGGPEVKTRGSTAGGAGSISGWGTKIPHALWSGQKSEKKKKNNPKTKYKNKTPKNKNQL